MTKYIHYDYAQGSMTAAVRGRTIYVVNHFDCYIFTAIAISACL